MVALAKCGHPEEWRGLYASTKMWSKASYTHPAKMSPALCSHIIGHLEDVGLLHGGDAILDPMAGIGTTGLVAAQRGYRAILVELEPKFVTLCQDNKAQLEETLGHPVGIEIVQGDARHLSGLLKERGLVSVTSPPYGLGDGTGHNEGEANKNRDITVSRSVHQYYGDVPGQIGALHDKPLKAVLSPPYEGQNQRDIATEPYGSNITGGLKRNIPQTQPYGDGPGQIGQEQGATYLSEMKKVYSELALVADVCVVVVKNPTRKGQLRRLDLDTIALLKATGWHIYCHHKAILFDIIDGIPKGRLSFFKRLAYRKGSPIAQWEDVIVAVPG